MVATFGVNLSNMIGEEWTSIILILVNVLISIKGFNDPSFFEKWMFKVDRIIHNKEYYRLLSSGFVHTSGSHLAFNMISLYFFAGNIESSLGVSGLLIVYFGSLLVGSLLSLAVHQNNGSYRAVGASGAVSGVVFAAIALFPGMKLALLFIPIFFPAWVFGLGFVAYSIYGMRNQGDNIGHEAHLGGALAGMMIALIFRPEMLTTNLFTILLIFIPAAVFLIITFAKPSLLSPGGNVGGSSIDDQYQERQQLIKLELNRILEKINQQGVNSLTDDEKAFLQKFR